VFWECGITEKLGWLKDYVINFFFEDFDAKVT